MSINVAEELKSKEACERVISIPSFMNIFIFQKLKGVKEKIYT
jgi:hypothetical protein